MAGIFAPEYLGGFAATSVTRVPLRGPRNNLSGADPFAAVICERAPRIVEAHPRQLKLGEPVCPAGAGRPTSSPCGLAFPVTSARLTVVAPNNYDPARVGPRIGNRPRPSLPALAARRPPGAARMARRSTAAARPCSPSAAPAATRSRRPAPRAATRRSGSPARTSTTARRPRTRSCTRSATAGSPARSCRRTSWSARTPRRSPISSPSTPASPPTGPPGLTPRWQRADRRPTSGSGN